MRDVGVVIPAAGMGRRMGGVRKAMLEIAGEPILRHTLRRFLQHDEVAWIAVALSEDDLSDPPEWLTASSTDGDAGKTGAPEIRLVGGGAERGDSVRAGIDAIPESASVLLVHDAARPLVSSQIIDRCIAAARAGNNVVAAVQVVDTIKAVDSTGQVLDTLDRNLLWRVQTPQAFPAAVLREAYSRAAAERINATDDAALVERFGGIVRVVEGAAENLKITTPFDRVVAELLLRGES